MCPPSPAQPTRYACVVPVKPPARGKTRLSDLPDAVRRELAAAFALDTVAACLSSAYVGAVLAVTDDAAFSAELGALGCVCIPDGVTGDLNGTLRQAAAEARRRWPDLAPVAVCADLPALRATDLDAALDAVGPGPAYVVDADGTGTTLYTAGSGAFEPRFGPGSAAAHALDAVALGGLLAPLRRDVDDLGGLQAARALGLGPRTEAVTRRLWG